MKSIKFWLWKLKAIIESLINMKILKLYAWETYFKNVIEGLSRKASSKASKYIQSACF